MQSRLQQCLTGKMDLTIVNNMQLAPRHCLQKIQIVQLALKYQSFHSTERFTSDHRQPILLSTGSN